MQKVEHSTYQAVAQSYHPNMAEYKPYAFSYDAGVKTYSSQSHLSAEKINYPQENFLSYSNKKVVHYLSNQQFLLGLSNSQIKTTTDIPEIQKNKSPRKTVRKNKKSSSATIFIVAQDFFKKAKTKFNFLYQLISPGSKGKK
jgi:hypothetical protein